MHSKRTHAFLLGIYVLQILAGKSALNFLVQGTLCASVFILFVSYQVFNSFLPFVTATMTERTLKLGEYKLFCLSQFHQSPFTKKKEKK